MEKHREAVQVFTRDAEYRQRQSKRMKAIRNTPEARKRQSDITTNMWKDPVYRGKMFKTRKGVFQSSSFREKMREISNRMWQDPEHRLKQLQGMLDSGYYNPDKEYPAAFQRIRRERLLPFRANEVCEYCGGAHDYMDIHHIDHNTKNNEPTNLIYLCRSCHNAYGNTDIGRKDFLAIALDNTRTMPIGWHEVFNEYLQELWDVHA